MGQACCAQEPPRTGKTTKSNQSKHHKSHRKKHKHGQYQKKHNKSNNKQTLRRDSIPLYPTKVSSLNSDLVSQDESEGFNLLSPGSNNDGEIYDPDLPKHNRLSDLFETPKLVGDFRFSSVISDSNSPTNIDNNNINPNKNPNNNKYKRRPTESINHTTANKPTLAAVSRELFINQNNLVSTRLSTVVQINNNITQGWKNAIMTGNDTLVKTLYNEYAKSQTFGIIKFEENNGKTILNSLMMSCKLGKNKIVKFIIDNEIINPLEINDIDETGNSALHYACYIRNYDIVKMLIDYGADMSIINKNGLSPMDICQDKRYRNDKIRELFKVEMESRVLDDIEVFISEDDSKSEGKSDDKNNGNNISGYDRQPTIMQSNEEKEKEKRELELYKIQKRDPLRTRKLVKKRKETDPEYRKDVRQGTVKNKIKKQNSVVGKGKEILLSKQEHLPKLEGWLKKQRPHPPHSWQSRWVLLKDNILLWNDKEQSIKDVKNVDERNNFNGNLSINIIKDIITYEHKKKEEGEKFKKKYKKRFVIQTKKTKKGDSGREYCFECQNEKDRDYWLKGIKKHMKFYKEAIDLGFII